VHTEHDPAIRSIAILALLGLLLFTSRVLAQQCPPQPDLSKGTVTLETKGAVSGVLKVIGEFGLGVNFTKARNTVLDGNPRADEAIVVMTMAATLCPMIWTDTSLSGSQKAERFSQMMFEVMLRVHPGRVAGTESSQQRSSIEPPSPVILAAAYLETFDSQPLVLAQAPEVPTLKELQAGQTGWLRDPPFYITDFNKYFVIVGSPDTEEEGRRMLRRFKSKAPKYDFQLYAPYSSNTHYAVMMATWVPEDVAEQALVAARRDVVHDAYIWQCPSKGESC
jgi:hypothetical protein